MNVIFQKLRDSLTQQAFLLNKMIQLHRATPSIQHPVWGITNERQYYKMPTHGIGRWRHLLEKKVQRKKKDHLQMVPVVPSAGTVYGTLNVTLSGYDMTVVKCFSQYIHHMCNRLNIKVEECYALPTKTTEVMVMPKHGTKMSVDAVLKTHRRVVQLRSLSTELCPIFMDVLLKNLPEGVQLSVKEHTEEDFKARFKERPELQDLMAKLN
ncbi:large ribosomal subunit protein mL48 [Cynoglossus semilaevis]|uniref:Large ribosomal subunit protein mL48 n=1 Tax=Cynoglossus semilaevis TaxID=244447 RepID=A0A3P8WRB2_CYNSE|nr:39S ribosomal protein L48, mitochondrial [Cynoglossus semilaevis]